jgi:hypothetical protein
VTRSGAESSVPALVDAFVFSDEAGKTGKGGERKTSLKDFDGMYFAVGSLMRVLWLIGLWGLTLASASPAIARSAMAPPSLDETNDADKKAEYLERIPYKPCLSTVRMPNGKIECLGSPERAILVALRSV